MDTEDANFYKYAAERIFEDLQNGLVDFKTFFFGDPFAIPISQLPCVVVEVDTETQNLGPTGHDRIAQTIIIKIVLNKRDDFAGSEADSVTHKKLVNYMSARDATTKQWLPSSVLGIVRKNLTLDNLQLNMSGIVKYGIVERPAGILTAEAQLTITTEELVQVDNRV